MFLVCVFDLFPHEEARPKTPKQLTSSISSVETLSKLAVPSLPFCGERFCVSFLTLGRNILSLTYLAALRGDNIQEEVC